MYTHVAKQTVTAKTGQACVFGLSESGLAHLRTTEGSVAFGARTTISISARLYESFRQRGVHDL